MFKRIMTVSVLGVSALGMMAANATTPSIYITGQAGYANTHLKNKLVFMPNPQGFSVPDSGEAGRLAIGYQFNQNFAVELGYLQLSSQKGYLTDPKYAMGTVKLKQNAADILVKGMLPISDKFNLYGKIGAAYLTSTLTRYTYHTTHLNKGFGIAKHKWAPEAVAGISYDINSNVFVDTSWTHIQPLGKNKPGNIDFVAVGLGYSFG